jgi:hypothetical protein
MQRDMQRAMQQAVQLVRGDRADHRGPSEEITGGHHVFASHECLTRTKPGSHLVAGTQGRVWRAVLLDGRRSSIRPKRGWSKALLASTRHEGPMLGRLAGFAATLATVSALVRPVPDPSGLRRPCVEPGFSFAPTPIRCCRCTAARPPAPTGRATPSRRRAEVSPP